MRVSTFESKPCSRCGGSGHYSFCPSYGTTCFKCHGRGWVLTARGAAANAYFSSLLHVPARLIEVGDLIFHEGISCGSFSTPSRWEAVTEIRPGNEHDGGSVINGVTIPPALVITTGGPPTTIRTIEFDGGDGRPVTETVPGGVRLHCSPETPVRRGASAATKRAARAKALFFQSTLNAKGEPMARRKKEAA